MGAIDKSRERESMFNEYQSEIRKKDREEKEEKRKIAKKDFKELLKETSDIDRHSHWSDIKKVIENDQRYTAVESSSQRQDWFDDYVQELKDEHRREKDKKKDRTTRSRSRSRHRSRSRGKKRSRSRDRKEKKKKKDKKRDKRDKEEGKKDAFRALCDEKNVTAKTSWSEFSREVAKDERFKAIDKSRERESMFNEYQSEIRKKDREEKEEKRKIVKKDFKELLKETSDIDR